MLVVTRLALPRGSPGGSPYHVARREARPTTWLACPTILCAWETILHLNLAILLPKTSVSPLNGDNKFFKSAV